MRLVSPRAGRGAATLSFIALLSFPMAALADMPEIEPPVGGKAVVQPVPKPSIWEMLLVWVEIAAEIQPPVA